MFSSSNILDFRIPRLIVLGVSILFFALFFTTNTHAASTAGFNPARIIDDGIFTKDKSMSVAQIQQFLNNANSTCLKDFRSLSIQDTNGDGIVQDSTTEPYGPGTMSAAELIATAADIYNINPQVILVTLQKEQGLITRSDCPAWRYNTALGYGCPDTAPCDQSAFGFTRQIDYGTYHFRGYYDDTLTSVPYGTGPHNIYYNPNFSCGFSTVNISNRSTASLYNYTPYQPNAAALAAGYGTAEPCGAYGNRNFYLYFHDWFGSTLFPQPAGATMYRERSTGRIYLTNSGDKYYIPNWDMMVNYGLSQYAQVEATTSELNAFVDKGSLTNILWDPSGVYLVNNQTRHHVSSSMCNHWGLSCFDSTKVMALDSTFQTFHLKQGAALSELSNINGVIHKMENGKKLPIANPKTLADLGLSNKSVLPTNKVNANYPLGPLLVTTPGVISFSPSSTIYYYDGTSYFRVPDLGVFNDWKLSQAPKITAPTSEYNALPPASTVLGSWVINDGKNYLIDQGRRLEIPASFGQIVPSNIFMAHHLPQFNNLSSATLSNTIWSNPRIYKLENGQKRYIPTYEDYVGIEPTPKNTISLSSDKLASIENGPVAFASGKLVRIEGDSRIYVVNDNSLVHVSNPAVFSAYGYDWSKITLQTSSILTAYPFAPQSLSHAKASNGTSYIVLGSSLAKLDTQLASDYGLKPGVLAEVNQNIIKRNPVKNLSRFLYNSDNGRIYYASGGAIHYVASNNAFVRYGGPSTPIDAVNSEIISLFNMGYTLN